MIIEIEKFLPSLKTSVMFMIELVVLLTMIKGADIIGATDAPKANIKWSSCIQGEDLSFQISRI